MSCNIPVPSIERHRTPPHMSLSIMTSEKDDHNECLHYFYEQPFVLPESLPDDLVAFPEKFENETMSESPHPRAILKPAMSAQLGELERIEQVPRLCELHHSATLVASLKSHDNNPRPLNTSMPRTPGTLLEERHMKHFHQLATDAHSMNIMVPSSCQL